MQRQIVPHIACLCPAQFLIIHLYLPHSLVTVTANRGRLLSTSIHLGRFQNYQYDPI